MASPAFAQGIHNIGTFLIMCLFIRIVHSFGDFKQVEWHSQAALKDFWYGLAVYHACSHLVSTIVESCLKRGGDGSGAV